MPKAAIITDNSKCVFCNTCLNDEVNLGEKFRIKDITAHYYCVLLSYRTPQNGTDEQGLRGFLYSDIKAEIKRCASVICTYCREHGASMQCHKCIVKFHLPCGIVKDCMSQFEKEFKSYCSMHRPRQLVPPDILKDALNNSPKCVVCMDPVKVDDSFNCLWAPCCKKTWYHRICIQQLALSTASLFKCAVCSNVPKFKQWMIKYGIFIPERDAAWETVPNAFVSLQEQHCRCDVKSCIYQHGREKEEVGTQWEIIVCRTCGSNGTHIRCSRLKFFTSRNWECDVCITISARFPASPSTAIEPDSSQDGDQPIATSNSPPPSVPRARPSTAKRGRERRKGGEPTRSSSRAGSTSRQGERKPRTCDEPSTSKDAPSSSESDEENDLPQAKKFKEEYSVKLENAEDENVDVEADVAGETTAAEQMQQLGEKPRWDSFHVRKESRKSDSDTDIEIVDPDEDPLVSPMRPVRPVMSVQPEPSMKKIVGEPATSPEKKFMLVNGKLYEAIEEGDTITLKKQGVLINADSPEVGKPKVSSPPSTPVKLAIVEAPPPTPPAPQPPPTPPQLPSFEVVASRLPRQQSWYVNPEESSETSDPLAPSKPPVKSWVLCDNTNQPNMPLITSVSSLCNDPSPSSYFPPSSCPTGQPIQFSPSPPVGHKLHPGPRNVSSASQNQGMQVQQKEVSPSQGQFLAHLLNKPNLCNATIRVRQPSATGTLPMNSQQAEPRGHASMVGARLPPSPYPSLPAASAAPQTHQQVAAPATAPPRRISAVTGSVPVIRVAKTSVEMIDLSPDNTDEDSAPPPSQQPMRGRLSTQPPVQQPMAASSAQPPAQRPIAASSVQPPAQRPSAASSAQQILNSRLSTQPPVQQSLSAGLQQFLDARLATQPPAQKFSAEHPQKDLTTPKKKKKRKKKQDRDVRFAVEKTPEKTPNKSTAGQETELIEID